MPASRLTPIFATTALIAALATPNASAVPPPGPDPFGHDQGFFMRLSAGFGYGNGQSAAKDGAKVTLSGLSGQADLAFGGIITPNLALTGELFGMSAFEPTMTLEGGGTSISERLDNTSFRTGGLGIGLTYYIMPIDLYVAAAVGVGVGSLRGVGSDFVVEAKTDPGFAFNVMAGKEWWVSRRWGLGVALQFMFAALPDSSASKNWNVFQIGASFSATMN